MDRKAINELKQCIERGCFHNKKLESPLDFHFHCFTCTRGPKIHAFEAKN